LLEKTRNPPEGLKAGSRQNIGASHGLVRMPFGRRTIPPMLLTIRSAGGRIALAPSATIAHWLMLIVVFSTGSTHLRHGRLQPFAAQKHRSSFAKA
jgi:hypothetical protein